MSVSSSGSGAAPSAASDATPSADATPSPAAPAVAADAPAPSPAAAPAPAETAVSAPAAAAAPFAAAPPAFGSTESSPAPVAPVGSPAATDLTSVDTPAVTEVAPPMPSVPAWASALDVTEVCNPNVVCANVGQLGETWVASNYDALNSYLAEQGIKADAHHVIGAEFDHDLTHHGFAPPSRQSIAVAIDAETTHHAINAEMNTHMAGLRAEGELERDPLSPQEIRAIVAEINNTHGLDRLNGWVDSHVQSRVDDGPDDAVD